MNKPECYSPGRTKSYVEMAENDCFTCPERETCLSFAGDILKFARRPSPHPSGEEIVSLAVDTGLAYQSLSGLVQSPYVEGTDIKGVLIDFATQLLNKYGNLP